MKEIERTEERNKGEEVERNYKVGSRKKELNRETGKIGDRTGKETYEERRKR